MELSAFSVVDAFPPVVADGRNRYRELLEFAGTCDAAGLASFWVAEHHFHPGGVCPSPPVLLAAIGERTRRIRLGVLVGVLPFHEPVRLAEQYALLDQLVGGRLNLGLGSGYIPMEFEGFGIDPATKRARFDRAFETLTRAFRGDPVRVDAPDAVEVHLNVRPVQTPGPPVWIAVQRREALPFVARRGVSVALIPYATVSDLRELGEEIAEFRGSAPPRVKVRVSVALHLYAGPNPEAARVALGRYLDGRLATQSTFFEAKARRDPSSASVAALEKADLALIGSTGHVMDGLERYRSIGVDEVLGIFDFGGLAADEVRRSVRSLGGRFRRS